MSDDKKNDPYAGIRPEYIPLADEVRFIEAFGEEAWEESHRVNVVEPVDPVQSVEERAPLETFEAIEAHLAHVSEELVEQGQTNPFAIGETAVATLSEEEKSLYDESLESIYFSDKSEALVSVR